MPGLRIVVTNAGYAALVNAQHNGAAPVTIAQIGVTGTAFVPDASQTSLAGEIKRLATIAGGATGPSTMHVTIKDDSTDTYSAYGFGLYLADGTLFAVFGQATALLQKASAATMLVAADVIFSDVDAASLTFGDTDFQINSATTTLQGIVELATDVEGIAGTDQVRAMTPFADKAALDARLGAGAPTTFVKTLLAAATALAFRTALAIKGAASYDIGAGNGLDADKLDGQEGAYYAPLDSAALTGTPTAPTAGATDATLRIANTSWVAARIAALVNSSPAALDTLKELADALGDDPNFATTMTNALAAKAADNAVVHLAGAESISGNKTFTNGFGIGNGQLVALGITNLAAIYDATNGQVGLRTGLTGSPHYYLFTNTGDFNMAGNIAAGTITSTGIYTSNQANVVLSTNGPGGGVYLRPQGPNSPTAQVCLTSGGTMQAFPTGPNPGTGVSAFAFQANGSYGGGFGIVDGQFTWGFYDTSGTLCFGSSSGGSTGALTQRFTFGNTGNFSATGSITASGGFQYSDRRLKTNIKAQPVQRGLALALAVKEFHSWVRKADGIADVGVIAQRIRKLCARYVQRNEQTGLLAIDKAGLALEGVMDNALTIREMQDALKAALRRIDKLEKQR
jgi:hypothetical protein